GLLAVAFATLLLAGCISANQQTDVDAVNSARRSARLATLKVDSAASSKAQAWAEHMARTGKLEHTGGGTKLDTSGVSGWCRYGENVGLGPNLADIHTAFMNSPPHKANILGGWHRIGTGVAKSGRTYYVTEIFLRNAGTC
ncbi:MAG: CAP domain-containing protein, partial [Acidimicrobiales bacterium]